MRYGDDVWATLSVLVQWTGEGGKARNHLGTRSIYRSLSDGSYFRIDRSLQNYNHIRTKSLGIWIVDFWSENRPR